MALTPEQFERLVELWKDTSIPIEELVALTFGESEVERILSQVDPKE